MRKIFPEPLAALVFLLPLAPLLLGLLHPALALLERSLTDDAGGSAGLAHYAAVLETPGLATSILHTLDVGLTTAAATTVLGFLLAYAFSHARVLGDRTCRALALLPLYVPSVFFPVGIIHLFGRHGILSDFVGAADVYGRGGVIFGEIVFILPHTTLLLLTVLGGIDRRLYQVARTLGASSWRRFLTVTLPQSRGGIFRAFLVSFVLAVTDFGIPKVLGGDYAMLSTELFQQVIGFQNLGVGSALGVFLLAPSALAFALDLRLAAPLAGRGSTGRLERPAASGTRDAAATLFAWGTLALPTAIILAAVAGSFVSFWPYDLEPTLANYRFENSVYGVAPFLNSLAMSAGAAVAGAAAAFAGAYIVNRTNVGRLLSGLHRALVFLSLGMPGMVLGLAFVFAFNRAGGLFHRFQDSLAFLIFYCVAHFYAMGSLIADAGLASLDRGYENAGKTLGIGRIATLFRVVIPLRLGVLLEVAFYFFINSMTTVSGMIFIFSPDNVPASVAMLHFTDTGNYGEAAAMGALILATTLLARGGQELLAWRLRHF